MDAFILDAYGERDHVVVWLRGLRDGDSAVPVREPFTPSFFVRAPRDRLEELASAVTVLPGVGEPRLATRLCALEDRPSLVLEVPVVRHERLHAVARAVDEWGEFREHDLFDVDLRLSHRFFLAKGLFPFARVRTWSPGRYRLMDTQWDVDYAPPPMRVLLLETWTAAGRAPLTLDERLARATLSEPPPADARAGSGRVVEDFAGDEAGVLRALADAVRRLDPDVVLTRGGDSMALPHLVERARALDLRGWGLGRDGSPPVATRRARSFTSYGRVKHQPSPVAIRGRIHVDLDASGFYAEGGLEALVEQSRITSTPLQELARLTTGTAFSTMQVDVAKREGRLIPYRKNFPETPKNGHAYVLADRGALSFDPVVGVHDDCFELDFGSFFPRLMIHRNLSPETVLCACCDPADPEHPPDRVVPRLGYHVCRRKRGINARTLEHLVGRRDLYKRLRKTDPANLEKWQARSDVLKMELVTSFGYQGHKNHRHGRIEVHESINAWARHDLVRTTAIARDCGFDVLHGLSDSLWLKRLAPGADADEVARRVTDEVGVPFEMQGRYKWLVLLPNKTSRAPGADPVGALTRFYGCFDGDVMPTRSSGHQKYDYLAGGRLKVRGVELRQRSTPTVIRNVQEAALSRLALADDAAELSAAVPDALRAAAPVLARIRDGAVPLADLVVTNFVSREVEEYAAATHAWAALVTLKNARVRVPPGDAVHYVVVDDRARDPLRRVAEWRLVRGDERYDAAFYERLAHRALSSLLLPFGFTEERVAEFYSGTTQLTLPVRAR